MQTGRILVVVDPTEDQHQVAVERAAYLAKRLDKGLELLICYYDQYVGSGGTLAEDALDKTRATIVASLKARLDAIQGELEDREGLDVVCSVVWDHPLDEAVVRHVLRTHPLMVLKETHYHNALSRALFTHTDWSLIRKCPCPLWLAKPKPWFEDFTITAAVDPMQEHDKPATLDGLILNTAKSLSEGLKRPWNVFHSYMPAPMVTASAVTPMVNIPTETDQDILHLHEKRLHRLLEGYELDPEHIHLTPGPTHVGLSSIIESEKTGVVVMGAVARSSIKLAFIGSTAEKALPQIDCDLVIVKPSWFQTPVELVEPEACESSNSDLGWPESKRIGMS